MLSVAMILCAAMTQLAGPDGAPAKVGGQELSIAPSRIAAVTVFPHSARVTREVTLPDKEGVLELRVGPLPFGGILLDSASGEGGPQVRILGVRHEMIEDSAERKREIAAADERVRALSEESDRIQAQAEVAKANLDFLAQLEGFSESAVEKLADRGTVDAAGAIKLADHIMSARAEVSKQQVEVKIKASGNQRDSELAREALGFLKDAPGKGDLRFVLLVDKAAPGPATVRLSYHVASARWSPRYRIRAGAEGEPVRVECLAEIVQATGEDWKGVALALSTSEAQIAATLPPLGALEVEMGNAGDEKPELPENSEIQHLRLEGPADLAVRAVLVDQAATLEQTRDLLSAAVPAKLGDMPTESPEGAGVIVSLPGIHDLKAITEQEEGGQLLLLSRFEAKPEWYYATTPILSSRVFRMANLANGNSWTLLQGKADMYRGDEFVGRMELPAVPSGEPFTVGFGADSQVGVHRRLVSHDTAVQGGNQVEGYEYRIRLHSFKPAPIKVQVWDRIPRSRPDEVAVNMDQATPAISADPAYLRRDRPDNLLRWDVEVKPGQNKEEALTITYRFKLEFSRERSLGGFSSVTSGNPASLGGSAGMGGMGGMFSRGLGVPPLSR